MKNIFIPLTVVFTQFLYAQEYVHQVLVLNEGYYDFTASQVVVPPTIGSYDPINQVYISIDTLEGARFASDMIINGDHVYVAADNMLHKYDKYSMNLLNSQQVDGIRNLAVWNDKIIVTRGDYDYVTFMPILYNSYLQIFNTNDLSFYMDIDTVFGPKWSTQNMIVNNNTLYVAINNGFEWGNEKGLVGVLDLNTMNYTHEIDLGPDGKNPDNMVFDGINIYTVNNKDWSGSSISEVNINTGTATTINMSMVSTGCGTSCMKDNKIMYQISQDTELYEWDPQLMPAAGNPIGYNQNFYTLSADEINGLLYASSTDFFSYGTVSIYDDSHTLISSFNTSISPGKIVFDLRNAAVGIFESELVTQDKGLIYDISGKRVNSLDNVNQGIYIVDGKKIYLRK